ncbi:hypothetical protein C8F01DRAFT_663326 [Mycena amicta]|nr:hypothetical protein C8F01DRAFT_663326 [Mycena amicta]
MSPLTSWSLPTQATPASDASGVGHYSDFNDNHYSDFSSTRPFHDHRIHDRTSSFGDGSRQPPRAGGRPRALSDSASLGLPGSSAELDANVFEDEPCADDATNRQAQQLLRPPRLVMPPSPALLAPLWPYSAGPATSPVFSSPSSISSWDHSLSLYPTSDEGGSSPFREEFLTSAGDDDLVAHGHSRQPTIHGVDNPYFAATVDAENDLLDPLEISLQSFSFDSLAPLVAAWATELPAGEEFEKGHIAEYRADELPFPPSPQPPNQQHLLSPQPQSYGPSPILDCVDPTELQLPVRGHSTPVSIQIIEASEDPLPFPLSPLPPPSPSEFGFGVDFWSALSATRSPTVTPQPSLLNYSAQSMGESGAELGVAVASPSSFVTGASSRMPGKSSLVKRTTGTSTRVANQPYSHSATRSTSRFNRNAGKVQPGVASSSVEPPLAYGQIIWANETPQQKSGGSNNTAGLKAVGSPAGRNAARSRRKDPDKPGKYVCDLCAADFTTMQNLKYHYNSHNDEKHFVCRKCQQSFVTPHVLKRHELKVCRPDMTPPT